MKIRNRGAVMNGWDGAMWQNEHDSVGLLSFSTATSVVFSLFPFSLSASLQATNLSLVGTPETPPFNYNSIQFPIHHFLISQNHEHTQLEILPFLPSPPQFFVMSLSGGEDNKEITNPTSGSRPKPANPRVSYRECLKNHAANIGGNVTDGCGEFMPSGGDGTLEALRCAACSCHRNFHRKDPSAIPHWALEESSSEELNFNEVAPPPPQFVARKRFRTKFTAEQKGRMLELAEKVGWRIPREDDAEVQRFCAEVGVKRQVFKVWMHNNKTASSSKKLPHEF